MTSQGLLSASAARVASAAAAVASAVASAENPGGTVGTAGTAVAALSETDLPWLPAGQQPDCRGTGFPSRTVEGSNPPPGSLWAAGVGNSWRTPGGSKAGTVPPRKCWGHRRRGLSEEPAAEPHPMKPHFLL